MATTIYPAPPNQQEFVIVGGVVVPAAGYVLYTYASGTTTPEATYTDQSGTTPNANPIVLDSEGRYSMWLTQATEYTFVLKTTVGGTTIWTKNDMAGVPIVSATQYVPLAGAVTMTGLFTLSGNATSSLNPVPLQQAQSLDAAVLASASTIATSVQTATTSAGTSTAYTLTPANALASLATNSVRKVNFHTASGSNPTMAVSGLTAKSLKQYENDTKVAARVPSGYIADITYDGTDWVVGPSQAAYGTIASTGSYTLPGGLIVKWGTTGSIADSQGNTITFAAPFPNNCFGVHITAATDNYAGAGVALSYGAHTPTVSNFKINNDGSTSIFFWTAIGN